MDGHHESCETCFQTYSRFIQEDKTRTLYKTLFASFKVIKKKSTFRAKALRRELVVGAPDEGPSLETSIFPLSFQVVREPLPFAYH